MEPEMFVNPPQPPQPPEDEPEVNPHGHCARCVMMVLADNILGCIGFLPEDITKPRIGETAEAYAERVILFSDAIYKEGLRSAAKLQIELEEE